MRYSKQKGFTLIELIFVLSILGMMAILEMQQKTIEIEQMRARQLGVEVFNYSLGVQEYISKNSGRIAEMTANGELGTKTGVNWLRSTSCIPVANMIDPGTADMSYVKCEFLQKAALRGVTTYGHLGFTSEVTDLGNGVLQATTVLDELSFDGMHAGALSGLAAAVASGAWTIGQNNPTTQTTDATIRYCTTGVVFPECAANVGRIVVISTNQSSNDRWLRVDHGNNMQNAIEFDSGVTGVDTWGYGFSLRQIKNIARIYNEGTGADLNGDGLPDDALFLGKDGHIPPPTLASAGVIVDADLSVLGNFIAQGNIETEGGDIISKAGVDADGNFRGGNIEAKASSNGGAPSGGDIKATAILDGGGNPIFGGDVIADDDLRSGDDLFVGNNADIGSTKGGDLRVRAFDNSGNGLGQGGNAFIDMDLLVGHLGSGGKIHSRQAGSVWDRTNLKNGDIRADNDLLAGNDAVIERDMRIERNATILGWIKSERPDEYIQATGMIDLDNTAYYVDPNNYTNIKGLGVEEIEGNAPGNTLNLEGNSINLRRKNNVSNAANPVSLNGYIDVDNFRVKTTSGAYIPLIDLLPSFVHKATWSVSNGQSVSKPICQSGGIPKIILSMQNMEMKVLTPSESHYTNGGLGGWWSYASNSGGNWIVRIGNTWGSLSNPGAVLAQTYCSY